MQLARITFLGPCYKLDACSGDLFRPFSQQSRSGRFLRECVECSSTTNLKITYDNVLQTAFFDAAGCECNPTPSDLVRPLSNHRLWETADVVVGFGGAVRKAFELVNGSQGERHISGPPKLYFMRHPSYVMRRPKRERELFTRDLVSIMRAAH